jgi:hypothetical protein
MTPNETYKTSLVGEANSLFVVVEKKAQTDCESKEILTLGLFESYWLESRNKVSQSTKSTREFTLGLLRTSEFQREAYYRKRPQTNTNPTRAF